ncbi:insulinase family protein [Bacteroidales bacterium OttesenSCG-928-I14]|nr:insulinase family protein [Bacteroidales bacterium OttesenSCG-928-I14]
MSYESYTLSNNLRLIYLPSTSAVSYCGFAVKAGTRHEEAHQFGLAHFVEHMLFKGTKKRRAWHILNRMENVGGEINAYTAKEETFLYSVCLSEDIDRAMELLSDLIFNSQYPNSEIPKEKEVVIDEINSYKDNPSELIYDEFENLLFEGSDLGHAILGTEDSLNTFDSSSCFDFTNKHYQAGNMIFFFYGSTPMKKIVRLAEKYFNYTNSYKSETSKLLVNTQDTIPASSLQTVHEMNLHQSHVMIGSKGYSLFDKNRIGLYFLNNILGGPGMNSRLNLSLREKHGLVYTVESGLTSYFDTGVFQIYFGCDKESEKQCIRLVHKELKKLRTQKLNTSQFNSAIKQWKGQLGISDDQNENKALSMGKAFLHFNHYDTLEDVYKKIDGLSPELIIDIANDVFDESRIHTLIFR